MLVKSSFIQPQSVTTPTSSFNASSLQNSFSDVLQQTSSNSKRLLLNNSSANSQSLFSSEFQNNESCFLESKLENQATSNAFNEENLMPISSFSNMIQNIKNEKMNESKSFEAIKSLFDQTTPIQMSKMRRSKNVEEDDENFNSENDDEKHNGSNHRLIASLSEERVLSNSSSLVNLSSIQNSKISCSANNSTNAIQTKSSSSSSSSKNGSNKNSLHGSIEAMIEVS